MFVGRYSSVQKSWTSSYFFECIFHGSRISCNNSNKGASTSVVFAYNKVVKEPVLKCIFRLFVISTLSACLVSVISYTVWQTCTNKSITKELLARKLVWSVSLKEETGYVENKIRIRKYTKTWHLARYSSGLGDLFSVLRSKYWQTWFYRIYS